MDHQTPAPSAASADGDAVAQMQSDLSALRREVEQLRHQVSKVSEEVNDLWANVGSPQ